MCWQLDFRAGSNIALIFSRQRVVLILEVVEHIQLPVHRIADYAKASLLGGCQHIQVRYLIDVFLACLRMAADGDREHIIKAPQKSRVVCDDLMRENAEHLLWKIVLWDLVEVIERSLRAPAEVQRLLDMGLRPIEDLGQFLPILDMLEGHRLDRRASDNEAVEISVAN